MHERVLILGVGLYLVFGAGCGGGGDDKCEEVVVDSIEHHVGVGGHVYMVRMIKHTDKPIESVTMAISFLGKDGKAIGSFSRTHNVSFLKQLGEGGFILVRGGMPSGDVPGWSGGLSASVTAVKVSM